MTRRLEIYKCEICGNVIQILIEGSGEIVCCGQNMKHLVPQHNNNELGEKHAVRRDERENKIYAKVFSHPMNNEHYIQLIEAIDSNKNEVRIKFFNPNENPEYEITQMSEKVKLLELCNIHELWGE